MLGGGIITPNIQERKNGNMKRKGFTLVELLIVIVVIGILSAMMMLSSTEAVTSANASNIISNFRNLKTAALAWYVDNLDYIETAPIAATGINMNTDTTSNRKGIISYLNSSSATAFNFNFVGVAYADDTDTSTNNTYKSGGFTYGIDVIQRDGGGSTLADAKWYLTCDVPDKKVREKLIGRAKSVGILASKSNGESETVYQTANVNTTTVYYLVR